MSTGSLAIDVFAAASALSLMNSKKITSLCVHKKNKSHKTVGLVHMHDILNSNIN